MGKILTEFVTQMESDASALNIKDLLTDEELIDWELLVKVFTDIDIGNIGRDIKKINKFYNLKRWQEMSVLAFVKMMELMFQAHKPQFEAISEQMAKLDSVNPEPEYKGGMFG
jgi:hypothetical protein|tara:strand:- start:260 stop:598 length:339 start_codon:yes stop_codon:yes gene_type:complete